MTNLLSEIYVQNPCEICREDQGCALLICQIPYAILPSKHIFYMQNLIYISASQSHTGCQNINIYSGKSMLEQSIEAGI